MITAFPAPYPGELLYSTIARYQRLFAFPAARATAVTLFGSPNVTAVVDLPLALGRIAARLPPGSPVCAADLVRDHTNLGYFGPFLDAARFERVRGEMESHSLSRKRFSVAFNQSRSGVRTPEHLVYCPACVAEDRRESGEAYWRREHQLPGVFVCHSHGEVLWRGPPRRRDLRQVFVYHNLETWLGTGSGTPLTPPAAPPGVLRWLADQSAALFAAPAGTAISCAVRVHHRRVLITAGARAPRGRQRVRHDRAIKLLHCRVGPGLLDAVLTEGNQGSSAPWLSSMLLKTKEGVTFHPLRHLLLLAATETPVDVFLAEAMTTGFEVRPRSKRPVWAVNRVTHVPTTDSARDAAALGESMRAVCELLLSPGQPERITVAAVARRTSYRNLIQSPKGRIPRTQAFLQSVVEDLPSVRRRRLAWVAGRYAAECVIPHSYQLFERAGLLRREHRALEEEAREHLAWIIRRAAVPGRVVNAGAAMSPDPDAVSSQDAGDRPT